MGRGTITVIITAQAAVSIKCNHINFIEFILLIYADNSNSGGQNRSMVVAVPPASGSFASWGDGGETNALLVTVMTGLTRTEKRSCITAEDLTISP